MLLSTMRVRIEKGQALRLIRANQTEFLHLLDEGWGQQDSDWVVDSNTVVQLEKDSCGEFEQFSEFTDGSMRATRFRLSDKALMKFD